VDPALEERIEKERQLERLYPRGHESHIPEAALRENRLMLRMALRQERRGMRWVLAFLRTRLRWAFLPPVRAAACAAALLFLGFLLGRSEPGRGVADRVPDGGAVLNSLVGAGGATVSGLRIRGMDAATGRVQLSFDATSRVTVEGPVRDRSIQSALALAMRTGMRAADRLDVIGLLGGGSAETEIRGALTHALLDDTNPGVRLAALEALRSVVAEADVRQALQEALMHDENPGVRVRAVEVLGQVRDAATLRVMRHKMESDPNTYVRFEARDALERWHSRPAQDTSL